MSEPIIIIKGLEGNAPTHLVPAQEFLASYLPLLIHGWWIVFFATLTYLIAWQLHVLVARSYSSTTE
jgi:hypothetical protein